MARSLKFSFKPAVGPTSQNYKLKFEYWFEFKVWFQVSFDIFSNSELNVRCLPHLKFPASLKLKSSTKEGKYIVEIWLKNFKKTIPLCNKKRIDQFNWRPLCSKSPLLEAAQLKIESYWETRKPKRWKDGTFCTKSIHIHRKIIFIFLFCSKVYFVKHPD